MKKIYLSIVCIAALALMACGGNSNKTEAPEESVEQVEETAETETPETTSSETPMDFEDFSAQLKGACGVAAIANDKMTKIVVRKDDENKFFMASPVTDDIDKDAVQREYFNAFAKVADGNNIYGFHMNGERGTDAFKDYDEYVKFIKANGDYAVANYGYDYKGKPVKVSCFVAFGDFGLDVTIE
ncbi:MAG: hypothetical protein IJ693_01960 [Bacteroidaceae bacterium]|nr:hypothetical protein [Bacteroidaceae bacterium]